MGSDEAPAADPPGDDASRKGCTFEAAGWSCGATGFLWFSEDRRSAHAGFPCPRCNGALFLATARRRGTAASRPPRCPCCDSGSLQDEAYRDAVAVAGSQGFRCT